MKYLIYLALLFGISYAHAQISVVDARDRLPVPGATMYRNDGSLIGFTNKDGHVEWTNSKALTFPVLALVQHTAFQSSEVTVGHIDSALTISLIARSIEVPPVEIVAQQSGDVIVLKGYFRALETFNHQHKSFSDGLITYYIPKKGKTVRYQISDHRLFVDSAVLVDYDTKMGPFFQIPRIAQISGLSWGNRFNKYHVDFSGDRQMSILKEADEVGTATISPDSLLISLYIDRVLPDSVKTEKLFRLEGKTRSDVSMESYRYRIFDEIGPYDLESVYQNVVGSIKRKQEYGHLPYEVVNEFYVLEREHISSEDYKTTIKGLERNIYKALPASKFDTDYWESEEISRLPVLKLPLGNTLKLITAK